MGLSRLFPVRPRPGDRLKSMYGLVTSSEAICWNHVRTFKESQGHLRQFKARRVRHGESRRVWPLTK